MSPEKRESVDCLCKNIEVIDRLHTPNDEDLTEISMLEFKARMCMKHNYVNTRFFFLIGPRRAHFPCCKTCDN